MSRASSPVLACVLGAAALPAARARDAQAAQDVAPGAGKEGVVHVSAIRNPEAHAYRAIVAGLDAFDAHRALAPSVPALLFQVQKMNGAPFEGELLQVRLSADDFDLPLTLDGAGRFTVPRSQAAWDARAELTLNRRKRQVQAAPRVRTPGLPDTQRRLGDIRLECLVKVAIAKEEMGLFWTATLNGILLSTDWCGWHKGEKRSWAVDTGATLSAATLRDGERSLALAVKRSSFLVPIGDTSWSNDAVVELAFAPDVPDAPAVTSAVSP